VKIIESPKLHWRGNIGVNKPNTDGDKNRRFTDPSPESHRHRDVVRSFPIRFRFNTIGSLEK
jgi:hypothetical protein